MTVLPTVRRQVQEAAERQASRPAWPRSRFPIGALAGAVGVAVALGVAILAVVLLGHRATATRSPTATKHGAVAAHKTGLGRDLLADGIGSIRFGQTTIMVAAGLERLFGRPGVRYTSGLCGFDPYTEWTGLDVKPNGLPGAHRLFRAQLDVYFKRSRFVGYSYGDDQYISRGAPGDETSIPLNSPTARHVLHGPRLRLTTAAGLAPGDPLARARRLYGQAFVETARTQGTPPNPRLERLPIWEATTASGRIYGGIDSHSASASFYSSSQRTIGAITAGAIPNTPCR